MAPSTPFNLSVSRKNTTLITIALAAAPLVAYRTLMSLYNKNKKIVSGSDDENDRVHPPFPPVIRNMLSSCRLAYLSTVDEANRTSHLCLMRFTYMLEEDGGREIIVMTTQRKTKKFEMLKRQKGVALLIHDFPQHAVESENSQGAGVYSITLNGDCIIVEDEEKAERYRAAHLKHNPEYPQFIVGDDIAVLCVNVTSARVCNIDDRVIKWDVNDHGAPSELSG